MARKLLPEIIASLNERGAHDVGTITIDILRVGALKRRVFAASLADLSRVGATVKVQTVDRGWIESTYYGIEITAEQYMLKSFTAWLETLCN